MKALHKYIRIEEKDRTHTINHYRHLVYTDPTEAVKSHSAAVEHLSEIDGRINQSVGLLHRLPAIEKKILPELSKLLLNIIKAKAILYKPKRFKQIQFSTISVK